VTETARERKHDSFALAGLFICMSILCAITWRKWGNVVIDCGRELYVPAAITQGKRLYFDISYPYGPLIPYWHSLLFRVLGVHVWVLEAAGIVIVGVTTWLIYSLSRVFLPASLAFTAGFAYLVQAFELDGFFQAGANYVLPYSYPAAYAVVMFVVLTWLLVTDTLEPKPWTWLVAGSIAGLETITKIEFGVSAWLLVGTALLVRALRSRSPGPLIKCVMYTLPGMFLALAVYGFYIQARGVRFLFADNISILADSYFMQSFGTRWAYVAGSVAPRSTILLWAVSGVLGVPVVATALRFAGISRLNTALASAAALALSGFHLVLLHMSLSSNVSVPPVLLQVAPFVYFNRGMVLTVGLLLIWTLLEWRNGDFGSYQTALVLMLAAGIMLAWRTIFKVQPAHYSIFYDVLIFIGYLVALWRVAQVMGVPGRSGIWWGTSAALCCGLISLTAARYTGVVSHSFRVGSSRGSIYESPETGKAFAETLAFLDHVKLRSEKFAVWPEEAALYYFSGTTAPSRWWSLIPGMLPPGEPTRNFLAELDRQKVKYIALSDISKKEYGVPIFGLDYNQQIYQWLQRNFLIIRTFGDYQRTIDPPHWAVQIWERKPN